MIFQLASRALLTRQKKSWRIIGDHCTEEKGRRQLFFECIYPLLGEKVALLDAGCGKGRGTVTDYKDHVRCAVGLDLGYEDLKQNQKVHACVQGDVHQLPFKDMAFDVVVSQWCIEHLMTPGVFFAEVGRVLKFGGHFVFATPNLYNYITVLARLTPLGVHKFFNRVLLHVSGEDTFRTYYRANTITRLDRQLSVVGLRRLHLSLYEEPPWLWTFSPIMCRLALRYRDAIMRSRRLLRLCGIIMATYRKET